MGQRSCRKEAGWVAGANKPQVLPPSLSPPFHQPQAVPSLQDRWEPSLLRAEGKQVVSMGVLWW